MSLILAFQNTSTEEFAELLGVAPDQVDGTLVYNYKKKTFHDSDDNWIMDVYTDELPLVRQDISNAVIDIIYELDDETAAEAIEWLVNSVVGEAWREDAEQLASKHTNIRYMKR